MTPEKVTATLPKVGIGLTIIGDQSTAVAMGWKEFAQHKV
jgi:hypothetical protein